MNFISHRGNIDGKCGKENHPEQIKLCVEQGYEVEIDVWGIDSKFYLGHDNPQYLVDFMFLCNTPGLWIHCKNIEALNACKEPYYNLNCFAIDKDDYVVTTHNHIWLSPTHQEFYKNAICVMPEDGRWHFSKEQLADFNGICSDNIYHYKNYVTNLRHRRSSH
jgi:hypothetical protein